MRKAFPARGGKSVKRRLKAVSLWLSAGLFVSAAAHAAPARNTPASLEETGEVLLQADELIYNRDTEVVTAKGNVEIVYGPRILFADEVTYEQKTGIVTAEGNIRILEPTGDVLFANRARLSDELGEGFAESLSVLMVDNTRITAVEAKRSSGNLTTFHKGVFSPCEVCEAEGAEPLWQIKSYKVIHNQKEQQIIYEDAFFEFFGIPVAYVPFFSHPDPTVDRQSGFLFPSLGFSEDFGTEVEIPYYWVIAPNMDATLAPRYTSKQGILYQAEFRHRTNRGEYEFDITGTKPTDPEPGTPADTDFRGSFFSEGKFKLDETWNWGFKTELTSDDTYLRRYDLSDETDLTSRVYVQGIDGRSEFLGESFFFQGLLSNDVSAETPIIAPLVTYHYEPEREILGGQLTWDTNIMSLTRARGTDSQRLSTTLGWESRHVTSTGEIFRPFVDLRGDIYYTDDVQISAAQRTDGDTVVRGLPTAGIEWRWPWVRSSGSTRQVVEPIVQLIYAPNGGNPDEIPNEDSLSFEFDAINLFENNRFPGLDRWEGGARANVGLNFSLYGEDGGVFDALIGQTLRFRENTEFDPNSGLREQKSDYVGRLRYRPSKNFSLAHRFRLDEDDFSFARNEVDLFTQLGPFWVSGTYAFFDASQSARLGTREELSATANYKLSDYWSLRGYTRRDLENKQTLNNQLGLYYQDECFALGLAYQQEFFRDRDIEPDNSIMLQLTFKHLGTAGFSSGISSSGE